MDELPIDTNNPRVKEYLSLIRLQVLTPLSLLINMATFVVCSTLSTPTLPEMTRLHPTSISPKNSIIGVYIFAIFAGQIGYCILLVLASKPETKKTLVKGVGFALIASNWAMAAWAVSWVFSWFLLGTIVQGMLLMFLVYSNLALLIYHPPTTERIFDMALIHAPMRFFLILPLSVTFPYSLFVTLHMFYKTTFDGYPINYTDYAWSGFGVVFGTNLLGLIVIMTRRDLVWCIAATWIVIGIWSKRPKPGPVYITAILFTILHPLALFTALVYRKFYSQRRITLPVDETDHINSLPESRPRQVDAEAIW